VLECVISLETFPFVERHYAELTNVPSSALFLVDCANPALPGRILPLAIFALHTFTRGHVFAYHLKVVQGGSHGPTWGCELMVKVALSLCLWPGSHL
jgi:hypothetical protein